MTRRPRALRVAQWLVGWASPSHLRDELLGDLEESWSSNCAVRGPLAASFLVFADAAASVLPLARLARRRAFATPPRARPMHDRLAVDARDALRGMRRRPWTSAAIMVSMVLGIGATTAVFSVFDIMLLQPLPYPAPDRLVRFATPLADAPTVMVANHADIEDLRTTSPSFSSVGMYQTGSSAVVIGAEPERVGVVEAGPGFIETLGLGAFRGRLLVTEDFGAGVAPVVVLSHSFWQTKFGSDPAVIGRAIDVAGRRVIIVGVLPPGAASFPVGEFALWMPLAIPPDSYLRQRGPLQLNAVGRLRDSAALDQARAELASMSARWARDYPQTHRDRVLTIMPLADTISGPVRAVLWLLTASVAAVLIIASANVGSLLLAHSLQRSREFAIRSAIGGTAARLARQLAAEHALLAVMGCAGGVWLSRHLIRALVVFYPGTFPRVAEITLNGRVFVISALVALMSALAAVLPLVWQATRRDVHGGLRHGGRSLAGTDRRAMNGLVVVQVAMSVVLMVASGLLLRTLVEMRSIDPGFTSAQVLAFGIAPPRSRYADPEQQAAFYRQLFDALRAVPGVRDVAWSMFSPLAGGGWGDSFTRVGTTDAAPDLPSTGMQVVSPEYVGVLGIPMISGRFVMPTDHAGAPDIVVVNQALATRYYGGRSPIGQRVAIRERTMEIVGVVGDVRSRSLWEVPAPTMYVAADQWGWQGGTVLARTAIDPASLVAVLRAGVRRVDPLLPLSNLVSLDERVAQSMAPERFRATLVGALGALSLVLSVLGIYGVVAYVVGRRTREIGLRIALGDIGFRVVGRILGDACLVTLTGASLGILVVWFAGAALAGFLSGGVRVRDPVTMAVVVATFLLVTLIAAALPARRASRVDPLVALRADE